MIGRIWKGVTKKEDTKRYLEYLKATGLKEYAATKGNLGTYVLTRQVGGNTEFLLLSLWRSMDDIKGFAGEEVEKAVYYPADKEFLLDMVLTVDHYEIAVAPATIG
jgi:heme-degrading monooxygenase HmoA